jgi:hypothetical protein
VRDDGDGVQQYQSRVSRTTAPSTEPAMAPFAALDRPPELWDGELVVDAAVGLAAILIVVYTVLESLGIVRVTERLVGVGESTGPRTKTEVKVVCGQVMVRRTSR